MLVPEKLRALHEVASHMTSNFQGHGSTHASSP
jgi:hypothetical protein